MVVVETLIVGLFIGVVVGLLGAGGGILSVPVLVYMLGQEPHNAAAGSLFIVALTATVSLLPQLRRNTIQWRDGLIFGVIALVGSFVGSRFSLLVDGTILMLLFGGLLIVVAGYMVAKARRLFLREVAEGDVVKQDMAGETQAPRALQTTNKRSAPVIVMAALCTGLLTGFFGVGGGFAVVPMLVLALGFPMKQASATSLVVMIIAAVSGMIARAGTESVIDWQVIAPFAVASMAGGMAGGLVNDKFRDSSLTAVFAALLAVVAIFTLSVNIPQLFS